MGAAVDLAELEAGLRAGRGQGLAVQQHLQQVVRLQARLQADADGEVAGIGAQGGVVIRHPGDLEAAVAQLGLAVGLRRRGRHRRGHGIGRSQLHALRGNALRRLVGVDRIAAFVGVAIDLGAGRQGQGEQQAGVDRAHRRVLPV
ncbi:hypothetical protein D3C72_1881860 [compost metagenome]